MEVKLNPWDLQRLGLKKSLQYVFLSSNSVLLDWGYWDIGLPMCGDEANHWTQKAECSFNYHYQLSIKFVKLIFV